VDWSKASSEIFSLSKSARGSGFETIETRGDLYLLVDALMIKDFMSRDIADRRAADGRQAQNRQQGYER
jgi:hypothetical protein